MASESPSFVRELECKGKTIQIKQLYVGDVGCVVWDAAIVLCKFLENGAFFPPGYWNGKRVVDVGSGTGVAGLAAAVMGLASPLYSHTAVITQSWNQRVWAHAYHTYNLFVNYCQTLRGDMA